MGHRTDVFFEWARRTRSNVNQCRRVVVAGFCRSAPGVKIAGTFIHDNFMLDMSTAPHAAWGSARHRRRHIPAVEVPCRHLGTEQGKSGVVCRHASSIYLPIRGQAPQPASQVDLTRSIGRELGRHATNVSVLIRSR
jgi:hypothetical protein